MMKRYFLTLTLVLFGVVTSFAQKKGVVIDAETEQPLANVTIANDTIELCQTNNYGLFTVPVSEGKIIFSHPLFDRVEFDYAEIPHVIKLQRSTQELDEVTVYGQGGDPLIEKEKVTPKVDETDAELHEAGSGNGNLLDPLNKLLNGKTRREKQKERIKDVLEEL